MASHVDSHIERGTSTYKHTGRTSLYSRLSAMALCRGFSLARLLAWRSLAACAALVVIVVERESVVRARGRRRSEKGEERTKEASGVCVNYEEAISNFPKGGAFLPITLRQSYFRQMRICICWKSRGSLFADQGNEKKRALTHYFREREKAEQAKGGRVKLEAGVHSEHLHKAQAL